MSVAKMPFLARVLALLIVLLAAGACGGAPESAAPTDAAATAAPATEAPATEAPATAEGEPLIAVAVVESLQLLDQEAGSDEVSVQVRGVLPDNCTRIESVLADRQGNTFNVTVLTLHDPGAECVAEPVPFEEIVALNVSGLEPGSYSVMSRGSQVSFTLGDEPTPEATAAVAGRSVGGVVWHDVCANGGLADVELPPGCQLTGDNRFVADGDRQATEEGVAGVRVALGEGACPSTALESAVTDATGAYAFEGLEPGDYCVFVDTADAQNQAILLDGAWTAPPGGEPQIALTLEPGVPVTDADFGWDFVTLPAAEVDLETCTNSFAFVEDVNIPDDTAFPPGAEFTKEWLLRNSGECPWSAEYSIVFIDGDLMGAEESIPLGQEVAPAQEFTVSIDMVAPEEPGTYRGNWQLADAAGERFGVDGVVDDAFWLQIVVEEGVEPPATPLPNSAAIGGVVWDDFCINSSPGRGCVESPADASASVADGTFDALEVPLAGIAINLAEGRCPGDGTLPQGAAVLETALTDEDGRYLFEGLEEGNFCVFMDALDPEMIDLLIPGNWTYPALGVGRWNVVLVPGEQALDIDFGWDYVD